MKVTYDPSVDMLYVALTDSAVENSDELQEGIVADYDVDGNIVGIEVFDASDRMLHPDRVEFRILEREPVAA